MKNIGTMLTIYGKKLERRNNLELIRGIDRTKNVHILIDED